ncbi:helix-turn-helix domain-containing protein [Kurthia massiliensis]|uniref:helix-turn-helix domain-containing protein n=1 Tax=Kurthia massiliensis TaxID=1033739 RepID=UPI000288AB98|nr:helix-turn-helix domain-containing protein [Kurthia massiliensis]
MLHKDHQALIHQTHGHCRFVYNHFLALWNTTYEVEGKGLNRSFLYKALKKMKKQDGTAWLRNVDSVALQASYENLINVSYLVATNKRKKISVIYVRA